MRNKGRNGKRYLIAVVVMFSVAVGWTTRSEGQSARVEPKADQILKK